MRVSKNKSIIIFGSTGDLVKRKILPSLFYLFEKGLMENSKIFCIGRKSISKDEYIKSIEDIFLNSLDSDLKNKTNLDDFYKNIYYIKADFDCEECLDLSPFIINKEKENNLKSRIFYLSVPADTFKKTIEIIDREHLINKKSKILIEKPFGDDYKTSLDLEKFIKKHFNEKQIFLTDHYLAKGLVLNIFDFKKQKEIKNIFNNKYLENININIFEKIGVEGRCDFYNKTGALKDFFQNHILQLISILFLENNKNIHKEKLDILKNIQIKKHTLKQYKNYKNECGVNSNNIETGLDFLMNIKNKKFDGVDIDLKYAKGMSEKKTEIILNLKNKDKIILDIQNNNIEIVSKNNLLKNFNYNKLKNKIILDDYKKIIYDALIGNKKYFVDINFVKKAWKIVDEIKSKNNKIEIY